MEPSTADLLSRVVRETSSTTGIEFFRSLVRSLASLMDVRYCMVTECLDSPPTRVRSMAFWASGALAEDFDYSVLETPCERVMLGESLCHGTNIQALYPDDEDLAVLEAESYAAAPLLGRSGDVLGHLWIMDSRPLDESSPSLALLEVFAERAAAELERFRAMAALKQSQAQLRQVMDLVPHFIFAKDRQGRFILANQASADAYGTTIEGLIGKSDADFNASAEEVENFLRDDLEVIESGQIKVIDEEPLTDASGRLRYLQTTKIPFTSADSDSAAVLGIAIDITRQRQLEEQRAALQQQVQHAQKMESLGLLAGGIAHDFNNLLTSIIGNVDLAARSLPADAPEQENLEEVAVAARHSAELAGQMLAYSGKGGFVFTPIDLNGLIEEMSGLLKRSINKKAHLVLSLEPDLPPAVGDLSQLRQVVMNLIINASDALGGAAGTIHIRTGRRSIDRQYLESTYLSDSAEPGEMIGLQISDDGCGMDEQTLERLFDPFFTTKPTGRGLGLSALIGIVRSHGGTVKVESEPGQGASFTVLLRQGSGQAEKQVSEMPVASPEKPRLAAFESADQPTILVADDEHAVLKVTRRILERLGLKVLTAVDGEEALSIFKAQQGAIDAVLLDITMPKLDGIETLKELKILDPSVKVLLTSGYSRESLARLQAEQGLRCAFIKKPFRSPDLERELRKLLG